jgi:hypothetical protein
MIRVYLKALGFRLEVQIVWAHLCDVLVLRKFVNLCVSYFAPLKR